MAGFLPAATWRGGETVDGTSHRTAAAARAPRFANLVPSLLMAAVYVAIAVIVYVALARVEQSFRQVMLFVADARAVDRIEPRQQTAPGKTDRLPRKAPNGNEETSSTRP